MNLIRVIQTLTGLGPRPVPRSENLATIRMREAADRLRDVSEDFLADHARLQPDFDALQPSRKN